MLPVAEILQTIIGHSRETLSLYKKGRGTEGGREQKRRNERRKQASNASGSYNSKWECAELQSSKF